MSSIRRIAVAVTAVGTAVAGGAVALAPAGPALAGVPRPGSFLSRFDAIRTIASTVPASGDVNPYGVVVVGRSQGRLHAGSILVSNFNNKANQQGTGKTIVQISPVGRRTLFASLTGPLPGSCPGGVGLTTALAVLPGGWVVVGSTPSSNGMAATAKAGCLIVLDSQGQPRETISGHGINGPWDATAVIRRSTASLFVTNVLNGTVAAKGKVVYGGTVLRLRLALYGASAPPRLTSVTTVGSGFAEQTSASAFVLGPTGVGLSPGGTLYVADTRGNRITAIRAALFRRGSAGTGRVLTRGGALNAPLGLTVAPRGDVLTVNGNNGLIVETTPSGRQVATRLLDRSGRPPGNGALFGLTLAPQGLGVYYVDDAVNTLRVLS
jgi:sugar lactone lactonase YvrE